MCSHDIRRRHVENRNRKGVAGPEQGSDQPGHRRHLERQHVLGEQDASHELRTPVAVLCGEAEVALSQPDRPPSEYRESLDILQTEAKRLKHIIEDLFTLHFQLTRQIVNSNLTQSASFRCPALCRLSGHSNLAARQTSANCYYPLKR